MYKLVTISLRVKPGVDIKNVTDKELEILFSDLAEIMLDHEKANIDDGYVEAVKVSDDK